MKRYLIPQILLIIPALFLLLKDQPNPLSSVIDSDKTALKIQPTETAPVDSGSSGNPNPITEKTPIAKNPQDPTEKEEPVSQPPQPDPKPEDPATPSTDDQTKQPGSSTGTDKVATPQPQDKSVQGPDSSVDIVYKSPRSKADGEKMCVEINQRPVILCKLGFKNNCRRTHVSDEISTWWMVCPMYTANTEQTKHLYELHRNFRDYAHSYGINFQTVEVVFPGQEFQLTRPGHAPDELQFKSDWIFAMRENLVNVGVKKLPDDWQYMAWIDQHIYWEDPYWFEKSILLFERSNIVHMLNGNDFWNLKNGTDYHLDGFGMLYNKYGMGFEQHDPRQCGLAWGMRREIFEELGGLFDLCIGTKCDLYQNYAYAGSRYTSQASNAEYIAKIGAWQDHAIQVYNRKLGYLDSKVYHFMHCYDGCKTSEYNEHVWALMRFNYNPDHDLVRDADGRLTLKNNDGLAKELWRLYGGGPRERLLRAMMNRRKLGQV